MALNSSFYPPAPPPDSDETAKWRLSAECAKHDPEIWFPRRGDRETAKLAYKICGTCPVQAQCRLDAETNKTPFGIWGQQLRNMHGEASGHLKEIDARKRDSASRARRRHRYPNTNTALQ